MSIIVLCFLSIDTDMDAMVALLGHLRMTGKFCVLIRVQWQQGWVCGADLEQDCREAEWGQPHRRVRRTAGRSNVYSFQIAGPVLIACCRI